MKKADSHISGIFDPKEESLYYLIYNSTQVGQMIFKEDMTLISANIQMFRYFDIDVQSVIGLTFGNVFNCSEVNGNNTTCCQMPKCKICNIRNCVTNIMIEDIKLENVTINYQIIVNGHKESKWFNTCGSSISFDGEKYGLLSFIDITQQKQREILLQQQLKLDLATGAMNKYSLMDSIKNLITPQDMNKKFSVCMTDFDNFKEINDQYGHLMGDKVLEVFTNITKKNIHEGDILGRYGGEEFVIIFRKMEQEQALKTIKRIQEELKLYFMQIIKPSVTFSAGLMQYNNNLHAQFECTDLINCIDKLLYQAKKRGKNRIISSTGEYIFL